MKDSIKKPLFTLNILAAWFSAMIIVSGLFVLCPSSASALSPVPVPQDLKSDVLIWGDFREDLSGPLWYNNGNTNMPNLDRVYVYDYPWSPNALIYDFGEKVSKIRVFPNIDHYSYSLRADSPGDAYEYSIYASNDPGGPWVEIVSPIKNNGRIDTGYYNYDYAIEWSETGTGTHVASYPDGWYTSNIWAHIDDYAADYELGGGFRYIKIVASVIGDHDPEMDALGALELAVIEISIDIKPGSDTNPINIDSKGVTPVAILTTADFDAADVNPDTVLFGPNGAAPEHYALEDVDNDGDMDMILQFRTQDTGIALSDTEAVLTGETYDGQLLEGADCVRPIENKGRKK